MKTIKLIFVSILFSIAFISCNDDNDDPIVITEENPLADYNMLTALTANGHEIEIYSEQKQFSIGYNELFLE